MPSAVFDDQFDLALRKLRDDPLVPGNILLGPKITAPHNTERPKLLNFAIDSKQNSSMRVAFEPKVEFLVKEELDEKKNVNSLQNETSNLVFK